MCHEFFRPSVDYRSDDNPFGTGTFSWQDPVHSWKAGSGEVMSVENLLLHSGWTLIGFVIADSIGFFFTCKIKKSMHPL